MSLRVLVVDDNREMASMIEAYLSKKHYQVTCCHQVPEALEVIKSQPVDVVISDVVFPDISGLSLLKTIKSRGLIVTVVMMSAYANREIAVECLAFGAYDFLFKPFRLSVLEEILEDVSKRKNRWVKAGILS